MLNPNWAEGELAFDFSTATLTCQPDRSVNNLTRLAPPLKSVDFYVWFDAELWLIEVKDPDAAPYEYSSQKEALSRLKNDALLKEHFLPKLYGSFCHLLEEGKDLTVPIRYMVVIGFSELSVYDQDRLTQRLSAFAKVIGPKHKDSNADVEPEVHNIESWNRRYPNIPLTRI